MIKLFAFCFIISLFFVSLESQNQPSTPEEIVNSYLQREQHAISSILKEYPAAAIGPVVQGGRVSDLAVNPSNNHEYYVAYASGGIFYTNDNGITFNPIFDNQGALGIGDMALAPSNENILYVGTGEKNSSRSSYAGSGVYKSLDKGKNWESIGLSEIHHTGRILVHPENPEVVWVAALGALYSHNSGRGVYKSINGGKSWEKTLYLNDSTGVVDLLINPDNPEQLWAATWERTRQAGNFKGHGKGSGVYRSEDGGDTWARLGGGLPENQWVGRIGIDLCPEQPNVLYALIDNQKQSEEVEEKKPEELHAKDFIDMSGEAFQQLDSTQLNKYLKDNQFPDKYNADVVKRQVNQGEYQPRALAEYIGDANKTLLEAKIIGAELYRSNDYGDTWHRVNSYQLEGVYNTYGYYFGEVRAVPDNKEAVYVFGVPLLMSQDGGVTYHRIDTIGNVHVDHQAFWINPENSRHMLLGNDGGLYLSYNAGEQWLHLNNTAVGQFYSVNVDMEQPYNVYGGLQDNGVYTGSSKSVPNKSRHWEKVLGGDGMFVAADPRNSELVYTGYQFGHYYKVDRSTGKQTKITPKPDIGEERLRFNWRAPVILSQHNADIIYMGAQKLFRSMDQGESWSAISEDLTRSLPQGNVPFSTIVSISESSKKFGLLYVGTDDGNVWVTAGGGDQWELVSRQLPNLWITNIHSSSHNEGHVYLSMNGYRSDDYRSYIYFSKDYGKTWESLKGNLPEVVINVIMQDPVNPDLLYLGSDHGAYASFDHGKSWHLINKVPNVAVYDLIVHPRDNELILATHGRSMYKVEVEPWQQIVAGKVNEAVVAFNPAQIIYSDNWGESKYPWSKPNIPTTSLLYYVGTPADSVLITISDENDKEVAKLSGTGEIGFHRVVWDLKAKPAKRNEAPTYVKSGKYTIRFSNNQYTDSVHLLIEEKLGN